MATIPIPVAELLEKALVGELTVVDGQGRPVTYPLIPLWDGERVYLTSSSLFSRKLEHIRANPKVSVWRSRSRTRSPSTGRSTARRSRATPGSSRTTRTAAGSGSCRSGRRRSRRSCTS